MNEECQAAIKEYVGGYKRFVAHKKQNGDMPLNEGKGSMSFDGLVCICKKAAQTTTDIPRGIFGWCITLLCWNLIARSGSVSAIMFCHLGWVGDAMTVVFPRHKGDPEGKQADPKHVFANPNQPAICVILALAVYVFTMGVRAPGSSPKLFAQKENTEHRFSEWMKYILSGHALFTEMPADSSITIEDGKVWAGHNWRVLRPVKWQAASDGTERRHADGAATIIELDVTVGGCVVLEDGSVFENSREEDGLLKVLTDAVDIGVHSLRKGVTNHLTGMVAGPSGIAIFERAGWSLGMHSRYITIGGGNDNLTGRAATGMDINSPSFGALPPHFDLTEGDVLSVPQWEAILPNYSTFYPPTFRQVYVHTWQHACMT